MDSGNEALLAQTGRQRVREAPRREAQLRESADLGADHVALMHQQGLALGQR